MIRFAAPVKNPPSSIECDASVIYIKGVAKIKYEVAPSPSSSNHNRRLRLQVVIPRRLEATNITKTNLNLKLFR